MMRDPGGGQPGLMEKGHREGGGRGPQQPLLSCPKGDGLRPRLTRFGGFRGEAAGPPYLPPAIREPLVSTARPGPALPATSAGDSGGFKARVFSGPAAPVRGSWAGPGSCFPPEGSGLRPLGPRKASSVPGSSTRTVTSSRNLEKGSLASLRRHSRARGPLAVLLPALRGSGVDHRPADACVSSWPGPTAQLGQCVWPSGFWPRAGLGARL